MKQYAFVRNLVISALTVAVMAGGLAYAQPADQPVRKTIFDYKAELGLSDDQEKQIRSILAGLNREVRLNRAKLTILEIEIEDQIQQEADLEAIREKLNEQARLQAETRYADLAAGRKINVVLTPNQLTQWRAVQAAARNPQ